MDGWISLHRKLLENPIFSNGDLLRVWIWCLLKATHKEHDQMIGLQLQTLKPGQFIFGRKKAAEELNLSENKIYRLMHRLQDMGNIVINSNNKYSIVSIVKWEVYQNDDIEVRQQIDNKQITNRQQIDTNNNVNNVNNANKETYSDFVKKILDIYPGKKTKSVRDKKLPKIIKKHGEDEILKAVKRYAAEAKTKDKRYILNESTFWNGRYLDYLEDYYEPDQNHYKGGDNGYAGNNSPKNDAKDTPWGDLSHIYYSED